MDTGAIHKMSEKKEYDSTEEKQWVSEEIEMYDRLALLYEYGAVLYKEAPWWKKLLWRLGV